MSGECTVVPGYTYPDENTANTNARHNQQANPTVTVDAGAITSDELDPSLEIVDRRARGLFWEEFVTTADSISAGSGTVGAHRIPAAITSGTIAAAAVGSDHDFGYLVITTNAGGNDDARLRHTVGLLNTAQGEIVFECSVRLSSIGSADPDFTLYIGLGEPAASYAEPTDGAYFFYNYATNSSRWQGRTANASTRTNVNGTVAAGTAKTKLRLVFTPGVSVAFYVGSTLIGTSTTNLPTGVNLGLVFIVDDNSNASVSVAIDYVLISKDLTR